MRIRVGTRSAKPLCYVPMNHVAVGTGDDWDTGLSGKLIYTQVNDVRASDCKPNSKV